MLCAADAAASAPPRQRMNRRLLAVRVRALPFASLERSTRLAPFATQSACGHRCLCSQSAAATSRQSDFFRHRNPPPRPAPRRRDSQHACPPKANSRSLRRRRVPPPPRPAPIPTPPMPIAPLPLCFGSTFLNIGAFFSMSGSTWRRSDRLSPLGKWRESCDVGGEP